MYAAKPGHPSRTPKPMSAARYTFEGQPRSTRRGVFSFQCGPSGNEATAAVETRAVDKWLPCINLLDYEWDKDSDSVDMSVSGWDLTVDQGRCAGHEHQKSSHGAKSSGAKSLMLG